MPLTAFYQGEIIARGSVDELAPAIRRFEPLERASDLLVFDDNTGKQIDLDMQTVTTPPVRGRGRPALGVLAKEVTLLPRHWEWLSNQRSGASATLRSLVDAAIGKGCTDREKQDAAYHFLSVAAGNLPNFEDAVRELYRGNSVGYDHFTYDWTPAIRNYGRALAWG